MWPCSVCTFLNSPAIGRCEMCESIKPRSHNDLKLEIIITGKNYKLQNLLCKNLEKAFISSFVYDWEWLESLLGNSKVVFAMHSRDLKGILKLSENRIAVIPPLGQYGCMHIKLLLLWYPGFMRLILPSANLIQLDWEDLENIVHVQDFPRISTLNAQNTLNTGLFYKDLVKILTDLTVPQSLIDSLANVDFSKARGRLVSSIPGKFSNQEFLEYGSAKLSQIVQEICPGLESDQEVYYQTSSLGATSIGWLSNFHATCIGKLPSKKRKASLPPFKILFPSEDTVKAANSTLGASSICFNRKYWNKFPKEIIRHTHSVNLGSLMHSKIILSHPPLRVPRVHLNSKNSPCLYVTSNSSKGDSWMYIGSHNCTLSAWGSISTNQEIFIRNWELGLVFGVSSDSLDQEEIEIPLPWIFPPKTYLETQEPWVISAF